MFERVYVVLEDAADPMIGRGAALGKVIEIHPDLAPLLDFHSPDPIEMAYEIGMVHASEEDPDDDLAEIDFGEGEWFEASTGLAVVERALTVLRADAASVSRYLYDPTLSQDDVIADLDRIRVVLEDGRDREVRFRLIADGARPFWPQP